MTSVKKEEAAKLKIQEEELAKLKESELQEAANVAQFIDLQKSKNIANPTPENSVPQPESPISQEGVGLS